MICKRALVRICLFIPMLFAGWGTGHARLPDVLPEIDSMTLEDEIGQLFLLTLYSDDLNQVDRELIAETRPGGVVLFPQNLGNPIEITRFVNALQSHAFESGLRVPLLIAVDQEGGRVSRLADGFTAFPAPMVLAATFDRALAVDVGYAMGQEMQAVGINMNLAPVVDLHTPIQDSGPTEVLYRRTLSSDPALVGNLASGLIEGMAAAGVVGVLKHFPGHGSAELDSHIGLPEVDVTLEVAERTALAPFRIAIDRGAPAVMVGHLYYPALDPQVRRPATLSPPVMQYLRDDLNFDGIVVTDAMDMGAIAQGYGMSAAIIASLQAGADLIAFGPHVTAQDQKTAIAATVAAVKSGELPRERVDQALGRLEALRDHYGLKAWMPLDEDQTLARMSQADHRDLLGHLAERAVTVVEDQQGLLPLHAGHQSVALVYPREYPAIETECHRLDHNLTIIGYNRDLLDEETDRIISAVEKVDTVIAFVENIGQNPQQYRLAWVLPPEKTVVVSLGSPYDWNDLPASLSTHVLTYDSFPAAHTAACRVLYGTLPARGSLPVAIGSFLTGTGVHFPAIIPDIP